MLGSSLESKRRTFLWRKKPGAPGFMFMFIGNASLEVKSSTSEVMCSLRVADISLTDRIDLCNSWIESSSWLSLLLRFSYLCGFYFLKTCCPNDVVGKWW